MLSVDALRISFDHFVAVDGISFSLAKGETLAIVGESGSGKSLTAMALMGLLPKAAQQQGSILLQASAGPVNLASLSSEKEWRQIRGAVIGMIFQEPMSALNPVMKVGYQLAEAIRQHQPVSAATAQIKAIDWLRRVQLPEPELTFHKYPHQLSGGQKQRIVIAIALCNEPDLIIADEPTTALDATVQQEIIHLMQDLQQAHGAAMIFITHDLSLAASIADKAMVMYHGQVVEWGVSSDVFQRPEHAYTQALLASRPSPDRKGHRLQTVADFMEKDEKTPALEELLASLPAISSVQPLLSVRDMQVSFTTKQNWLGKPIAYFDAVSHISFDLFPGEVLGLVGESGSGKSTISHALMGLTPMRHGEILYNGKDLSKNSAAQWNNTRRDIQLIFQDPFSSLNPRMTMGDTLLEGVGRRAVVIASRKERRIEVLRLLEAVRLPAAAMAKYPHQFSGGQRQRIGIARALSVQPRILLCDESVSALDVSVQAEILNLLRSLQQEFGLTYLFISHDLKVVHYISDRVLVLQRGAIVESGNASDVLHHPQESYTQKLVAASY